ncbi:MAG TPA: polymer-forming cytoskeletal protein [Terriglobales bacterium]|jgi:hypothetical protein|nr:polymer-forming cytoskeletal protein [Terriglobales bacterium]
MKQSAFFRPPLLAVLLLVCVAPYASAKNNSEYTQFGHDIRIGANQKTHDLTCIHCSIYVHGQVAGDVTAIHGNVVVDGDASVAGDVTAVLGDIRVDKGTKVAGDLTAVGGKVSRQPEATVAGDVTSLEGQSWFWLILGFPVLLIAGIIALIVWLVQRSKTRAPSLARAA